MYKPFYLLALLVLLAAFSGKPTSFELPTTKDKDYALFFALDNYTEWTGLRYPISDASTIAEELEKNYGFDTKVVKNPTRNEIYDKLEEYCKRHYASDSQLLIFL